MIKDNIKHFDINYKKKNEGIKEFQKKIVQCQVDNIEIMRDLSTYECNFAQNNYNSTGETFKERMNKMLDRVMEVKKMTG